MRKEILFKRQKTLCELKFLTPHRRAIVMTTPYYDMFMTPHQIQEKNTHPDICSKRKSETTL